MGHVQPCFCELAGHVVLAEQGGAHFQQGERARPVAFGLVEHSARAQGKGPDGFARTGPPALQILFKGKALEIGKSVEPVVQVQVPEP